jgi:hypothetical protein
MFGLILETPELRPCAPSVTALTRRATSPVLCGTVEEGRTLILLLHRKAKRRGGGGARREAAREGGGAKPPQCFFGEFH